MLRIGYFNRKSDIVLVSWGLWRIIFFMVFASSSAIVSEPDFSQKIYQKMNSRTAFLFLSLNFGEQSNSKAKKTSEQKQRENEGQIQQTGNWWVKYSNRS